MVFCTVIIIVALTSYRPEYRFLLRKCTLENGIFEWGSVIVLFVIGFYGLLFLGINSKRFNLRRGYRIIIALIAFSALIAAFEEISWGQHLFKFQSTEFFLEYNKQREMNVHNLLPPSLFGALVNTTFYTLFIFIPLVIHFSQNTVKANRLGVDRVIPYTPSVHVMLMCCFGNSLQAYFKPGTFLDTVALCFYLTLLAILVFTKEDYRRLDTVVHLVLVMGGALFFLINHSIFQYKNMQYEIREFIFMYAFLFWFVQSTHLLKKDEIIR